MSNFLNATTETEAAAMLVVACCHLAQHSRMKMKRKTQKDDCKSPREKNDTFFEGVRVTRQQEFHVKSYYI